MISIHIDANSGPELLGQIQSMARMLSPELPVQGQTSPSTSSNAETNPNVPAAQQEIASPKAAGRGRGKAATATKPPAAAQDPEMPAALRRDTDFVVYDGKGEQKAGYAHAKDAAKVMQTLLAGLTDVESVDLFSSSNEATLQRFDTDMREPVDAAILAKYESLGVDPSIDGGDGNDAKDVTKEDVRAAIKLLISEKGNDAALAVMQTLKAATLADIKQSDYAKALDLLNAARKGAVVQDAAPTAKKNLFDG